MTCGGSRDDLSSTQINIVSAIAMHNRRPKWVTAAQPVSPMMSALASSGIREATTAPAATAHQSRHQSGPIAPGFGGRRRSMLGGPVHEPSNDISAGRHYRSGICDNAPARCGAHAANGAPMPRSAPSCNRSRAPHHAPERIAFTLSLSDK